MYESIVFCSACTPCTMSSVRKFAFVISYPDEFLVDLFNAVFWKRCKIGGKLVLITNRKSHISFRLVPNTMTLNDIERRNSRNR